MAGELVKRTVELSYDDGTGLKWHDISLDALNRDPMLVRRGVPDEGGSASPAAFQFTLNNGESEVEPPVSRRYSLRNPLSDLYGIIGANTPVRLSAGLVNSTPHAGASNSDLADTTSHVAPGLDSPTGDALLMCAWAAPQPTGTYTLPGSMTPAGSTTDARTSMDSAHEAIATAGPTGTRTATFSISEDYVAASVLVHGTAPAAAASGGFSTVSPDITGEAGNWWVVATYFGWDDTESLVTPGSPQDTDRGGWILLADTGTLAPFDVDADFMRMKMWAKRVRTTGTHTITIDNPGGALASVQSVFWEVSGAAEWWPRVVAEMVAWPPRRDVSDTDLWVPAEAAGVLRRLGIPSSPLRNSVHRFVLQDGTAIGYWPLDDPDGSLVARPVVGGDLRWSPGVFQGDPPHWARGELHPHLPAALRVSNNGELRGGLVGGQPNGWALDLLFRFARSESGSAADRVSFLAAEVADARFDWSITLELNDSAGTAGVEIQVDETGVGNIGTLDIPTEVPFDGATHHLRMEVREATGTSTNVAAILDGVELDSGSVDIGVIDTPAPAGFELRWTNDATSLIDVGEIIVWASRLTPTAAQVLAASRGYAGEPAGRRVQRLCAEEQVPFTHDGDLDATAPMGPQRPGTFLAELAAAAQLEAGGSPAPILVEQQPGRGLHFNPLASLYLPRAPDLTLDFADAQLFEPFEPTPDDQNLVNDATARRPDGGQARIIVAGGPKGVDRAGRYDRADDFAALSDAHLDGIARHWTLHGTWDADRLPVLRLNLRALSGRTGGDQLVAAALGLREGSLLRLVNLPVDVSPEDLDLLVLGLDEVERTEQWLLDLHAVPAAPFTVGVVDDTTVGLLQSDAATLNEPLDTTETAVDIHLGAGPDWVHEGTDYDVTFGGERVTVTAVGAASGTFPNSLQTLTVTRSVNGIVKPHPAGAEVTWFPEAYIGLWG